MHKIIRDIAIGLVTTALGSSLYIGYGKYRAHKYKTGKLNAETEVIRCTNELIRGAKIKYPIEKSLTTIYLDCIEYASNAADEYDDKSILAQAYIGVSRALWELGNKDDSISYANSSIALLKHQLQEISRSSDESTKDIDHLAFLLAEAQFDNGWNYAHTGRFEESNLYYQESLKPKHFSKIEAHLEDSPFFDAHIQMARNYDLLGKPNKAINSLREYIEGSRSRVIHVHVLRGRHDTPFLNESKIPHWLNYNCIVEAHLEAARIYRNEFKESECQAHYNEAKDIVIQVPASDFYFDTKEENHSRCQLYEDIKVSINNFIGCHVEKSTELERSEVNY